MKHLKPILILVVVVVVLILLGLGARSLERGRGAAAAANASVEIAPWPVRVRPVTRGDVHLTYGTLGTLESIAEVQVAGQFPGAILELGPREGQRVEAGELLARIDTEEFDADLASREAELDAAREESSRLQLELEREQKLLASGGSTQSKVDASKSAAVGGEKRVAALEQGLEALRTRRGYARVTAPVAGTIKSRLCEVGDLCAAYHPLFVIDVDGPARLTLHLPQALGDAIEVGTRVSLLAGSRTIEATLTRIHPELSDLALIVADADLESLPSGLRSGTRVEASLLLDELAEAMIVPRDAIFGEAGTESVLLVREGSEPARVEVLGVQLQLEGEEGVAVTVRGDGVLKAGDLVIVGRPERLARLRAGDAVQVFRGGE